MSANNPFFDDSNLPGDSSSSLTQESVFSLDEDDTKENTETAERKRVLDLEAPVRESWFTRLSEEHQALLKTVLQEDEEWDMNADINASFSIPKRIYARSVFANDPGNRTVYKHTPLTYAVGDNLYDLAAALLANGADPDRQTETDMYEHRYRPLDFLCSNIGSDLAGVQPLIKLLSQYNADYLLINTNWYIQFHNNVEKFLTADHWITNKMRAQIYRVSFASTLPIETVIMEKTGIQTAPLLNIILGYTIPDLKEILSSLAAFPREQVNTIMLSRRLPVYMARLKRSFREDEEEKTAAEKSAILTTRLATAEKQIAELSKENARLSQALASSSGSAALSFSPSASPSSSFASSATKEEIAAVARAHAKGQAEWQV